MTCSRLLIGFLFAISLSALAAPGDILFQEAFNSESDLSADWVETENQAFAILVNNNTAQSPSTSVRIGRRGGNITSIVGRINADVPAATLTFWIRRGADSFSEDPDGGENLVAEYRNSSGNWIALETFAGAGTPGEIFNRSFDLPNDALYSNLQLRFRHVGANACSCDYWHIDDVVVTEGTAPGSQTCETFRDNFNTRSYSNNDGSVNWSGDWQEQDSSGGGATSGLIQVQGDSLRLQGNNTIANTFAVREADTSAYTTATLNFDFQAIGGLETEDAVLIEVSSDGGSNFTELERIQGISGSASGSRNYNITNAIAANTQVRIRIAPDNNTDNCCYGGGGETFIVDNLEIEACRPAALPQPTHEWRFDEASWTSTAGVVDDNIGSNNGTVLNDTGANSNTTLASTAQVNPAIATDASGNGTCGYGVFDGSNDYIEVNNTITGDFTITAWINTSQVFQNTQLTYLGTGIIWSDVSGSQNDFIVGATRQGNTNRLSFFTGIPDTSINGTSNINTGDWVHIAVTRRQIGGQMTAYVNGTQEAQANGGSGLLNANPRIHIGGNTGDDRFFNGLIDEVRLYNTVLTQTQIQQVMTETHSCPVSGPDHYSITAANGVACAPISVTVAAHDSSHGLVDAQGASVTLTTSTGRGTWSGTGVVDATPGDGIATLTFAAGASSANVNLSYSDINVADSTPTSDTFTVTVSDGSVDNAPHRPDSTVSLAGFQFGTGNFNTGIPNQVAGVASSGLRLRAVRTNPAGNCVALYPNETRNIGFAATYRNPTTGAGVSPTINSTAINSVANGSALTSYTNVSLSFDTNAIANITFNYNDVGQLQLHAQDSSGANLATTRGSSGDFVVRPHHFDIAVASNPGTTTNGNGFVAAGAAFSGTVTARANGGALTPNYGRETSPENVSLAIDTLVMPVGGSSAGFSGGGFSRTANGTFTSSSLRWNEVGTITLVADVADGNYLGAGSASSPTASGNVGRFYPANFALSSANTNNGCGGFTYMGQPNISVSYNLAARNTAGTTTTNYSADSDSNAATLNYPVATIGHRALQGATDLSSRLSIPDSQWVNGVYALSTTSAAINRQTSTAPDGPYTSVQLSLTEDDPNAAISGSSDVGSPLNMRFGRAHLESAHGPESTALTVPFGTEYWDGNRFVASTTDSCTTIAFNQMQFNNSAVTNPQGVDFIGGAGADSTGIFIYSPIPATNASTAIGSFGLTFSPPGAGNTGSFPININLNNYPWLRSDWNQDGNFNNDTNLPESTVSFGSYRGHDRVIYWRERFD
ncbi:LamG domain-containing protein [Porticoccus sp. W117]|uniref:LamG domain-containing protein n=1 Tax=Porticoccus sp. W117 TaxID=3054777 RepID=UPI002591CB56|nr:LamG domain-containing protein [Porticoccus sp. W117]MDM3870888.1 LamG domain-containing protein [Porticoccus sp. W117]